MARRLLVVDDSELIHKLVDVYLMDDDAFVICGAAHDGAAGAALAGELQPDAVLLDYEMPLLDGLDALPRIRAAAPDAVVVMYTSADDSTLVRRAEEAGAHAYFVKGVHDIEAVFEALRG